LLRLYEFYIPFEVAAQIEPDRSRRLAEDLISLTPGGGAFSPSLATAEIPRLDTEERRLGALYVVEGAALGGRQLARNLDRLLGAQAVDGRRFFTGRGDGTGDGWRDYLARLSAASDAPRARAEVTEAAVEIFTIFEQWLAGWSAVTDD